MTKSPEEIFGDSIRENLMQRDAIHNQLRDMYARDADTVRRGRCLVVRCLTGCLLLDVWKVAGVLAAHQPPYRLSPTLNDRTSSESGRRANTLDGHRRWKAQTYTLESARTWEGHSLNLVCDHTNVTVHTAQVIALADATPAGKPQRVRVDHDGVFLYNQ